MISRIIYGTSKRHNTEKCIKEINAFLRNYTGENLILMVPEQFSSYYEHHLVEKSVEKGSFRAEILTFKRLAYRVFASTLHSHGKYIDNAGKGMLMYEAVTQIRDRFQAFERAGKYPAFAGAALSAVKEFKRHGVTPENLSETAEKADSKLLAAKLKELAEIYGTYDENLKNGGYSDADDDLMKLAEELKKVSWMGKTAFWFNGFDGFTPAELKVIEVLMEKSKAVTSLLCCDSLDSKNQSDVFYPVTVTAGKIIKTAEYLGIITDEINNPVIKPELSGSPGELEHLISNYFRYPGSNYTSTADRITIYRADSIYEEVERCALEIMKNVSSGKMRYGDICVVSGLYEDYKGYIAAVFSKYDIPVFLDEKRSMTKHPVAAYLLSLLDIYIEKYSYEAVFSFLKSSYSNMPQEDVFKLENYVIQWDIKGVGMWTGSDWDLYIDNPGNEKELDRLNKSRKKVTDLLSALFEKFRYGITASDFIKLIYNFLTENEVYEKIKKDTDSAVFNGNLEYADELKQSWNILMDIFDQMKTISGDKKQTVEKYRQMLEISLMQKKIGVIPPRTDVVFAGTIEKAQGTNTKLLIIIGTNDPGFPGHTAREGLLTDRDRNAIKGIGLEIAADSRTQMLNSQINVYNLLNVPKEQLYASYSTKASDGSKLRRAGFIDRILDLYENLGEQTSADMTPEEYILTPMSGLSALNSGAGGSNGLERWLRENGYLSDDHINGTLSEISFRDIAKELYGEVIESSVTALEAYAECPYKYFAGHSLYAQPRRTSGISPPDIGSILHDLLKHLVSTMLSDKDADYGMCLLEARKAFGDMRLKKVFGRDKRREYLGERLVKRAVDSYYILKKQIESGSFVPVELEAAFGRNKRIGAPCFAAGESHIYLRGRIDRIDTANINDKEYFRIIDYKSSDRKLKLFKINEGLDLQLASYLMAYGRHSGNVPAGMYYFTADRKPVKADYGIDTETIEGKLLKAGMMEGYTFDEPDVLRAMDGNIDKDSLTIPIKKILSPEQLNGMMDRVSELIVENTKSIYEGEYEANPIIIRKQSACVYCEYKSICGFDGRLPDYNYRYVSETKDEEVSWGKNE